MSSTWYALSLWGWIVIAAITLVALFRVTVPFGKFTTREWGARITNRIGWFVMELPALAVFPAVVIATGAVRGDTFLSIILGMWVIHYFHRTVIYPFRIRLRAQSFPIAVVAMGFFYNVIAGSFLGYYYTQFYVQQPFSSLLLGRMAIGLAIFASGFLINIYHDSLLINLRRNTRENTYSIPTGGLFSKISAPNLFGEVTEWVGFAILAWSLPALSVVLWTGANLIPRAYSVHKWYQNHFPEYPPQRKAFFPPFIR